MDKEVSRFDVDIYCEYDVLEYTPANESIDEEELPSSSENNFYVIYAVNIIMRASGDAWKHLTQELLTFFNASTLNAKDYKTELPLLSNHKSISKKMYAIISIVLTWILCLYRFNLSNSQKQDSSFFLKDFLEAFKKQLLLLQPNHLFQKRNLPDLRNNLFLENFLRRLYSHCVELTCGKYNCLWERKFSDRWKQTSTRMKVYRNQFQVLLEWPRYI